MLDAIHDWPLFIAAGLLLNLTPGADMALIASRAAAQGWRIGAAAALGVGAGCSVHVAAAAAGLGALLAGSPLAFTLLRWVGAAYLVWLGLGLLRSRPAAAAVDGDDTAGRPTPAPQPWRRVFWQGFLTNALNPKVALFFLAFVPQFIPPDAPHKAWTFLVLGLIFNLNSLPINLGYAWLAAWAARRLDAVQKAMHWLDRAAGLMFLGFGLRLAMTDHPAS